MRSPASGEQLADNLLERSFPLGVNRQKEFTRQC